MMFPKRLLLILSCAGMILACFYAWTSFIFAGLSKKPIPTSEAALVLLLAMLITYIHKGRGWLRIVVVLLHITGFTIGLLRYFYLYFDLKSSFFLFGWFSELLEVEKVGQEWPMMFLMFLFVWILWFCGLRLMSKPTDKVMISYRFDMGLGLFLFLFLIKLALAAKEVSLPVAHSSTTVVIAYMVLGLFSMGLVHTRPLKTEGAIYLKGIGTVLTFTFIIMMLSGGLFILFLPQFQMVAQAGYGVLGTLKGPLESILILIARIFLKGKFRASVDEGVTGKEVPTANLPEGEVSILLYLLIGIGLAILFAIVGYFFYKLLKWFFSKIKWLFFKTAKSNDDKGLWGQLLLFFGMIKKLYSRFRRGTFKRSDTLYAAERIYLRLLRWGKWSGLSRSPFVTPQEYGAKLGRRFPPIAKEFGCIIQLHDETVYGGIIPEIHKINRAKRALRKVNHPYFWFTRFKSLLFDHRY